MIDLHTHTDHSDGATSPGELVRQACEMGMQALAISDHDTLSGYDAAKPFAERSGLELICAVELSTRQHRDPPPAKRQPSVHVLGYFLHAPPTPEFREWLETQQASRRQRNFALVSRLCELGLSITIGEVEVYGRNQVGRPHFARVLLEKGYVKSRQEAFDRYLADDAQAAVDRDEPSLEEGVTRIREAGGLASLAHPVRLTERGAELANLLQRLMGVGLGGIEVFHSEHSPANCEEYADLARRLDLIPTGGSDFHGDHKRAVRLGTGIGGNVCLDYQFLRTMRERTRRPALAPALAASAEGSAREAAPKASTI